MSRRLLLVLLAVVALAATVFLWPVSEPAAPRAAGENWPIYGGTGEGTRYSELLDINRWNVSRLEVAWQFDPQDGPVQGPFPVNPIAIDGVLYSTTPGGAVVALDGASGRPWWTWNEGSGGGPAGVAFWSDERSKRILAVSGRFLHALDANSGQPVDEFGDGGRVELYEEGKDTGSRPVTGVAPGVVYEDLYVLGVPTAERGGDSPGDIRAYDVRTGQLRWSFHTVPLVGEVGYDTWPADARPARSSVYQGTGLALDATRGIVFIPTGPPPSTFVGTDRTGDNLFANSLLALDARSGTRLWHFQGVRHDLWDRGFTSPPALVTIEREGRRIDAVAQPAKHGVLFVLDRTTGEAIFPIEQRAAPASAVTGEAAAETQPVPLVPAPFARQTLDPSTVTARTPAARQWALEQLAVLRNGGPFTPLAADRDTVIVPGIDGGPGWGGAAVDPTTAVLYVGASDVPWVGRLGGDGRTERLERWLDPDGYPAVSPPWGTLTAIDLTTGEAAWTAPLGEYPELAEAGLRDTGSENDGGPLVTAGGVLFIAGTYFDRKVRAFDKDTGRLLWESVLVNSGNSTPTTYLAGGKQYVVVPAFGSSRTEQPSGGAFVAFAMP